MFLFQFPLVRLFCAYISGIIWAFYFPIEVHTIYLLIAIFCFLLYFLVYQNKIPGVVFYPIFFVFGILNLNHSIPAKILLGKHRCHCTVLKKKQQKSRLIYWMDCQTKNETVKCEVQWFDKICMPELNEEINIDLILSSIPPTKKTAAFDYTAYLKRNGISTMAKVKNTKEANYISINIPQNLSSIWREKWVALFRHKLSERASVLTPAILFGDKTGLEKETKALFSQAGIIHILAVSGLHVGMIYILVFRFLFWIGKRPRAEHIRNFISLLVLVFYAWICGFSPSISRAVLMFAMLFSARLFLKSIPTLHQLILSAFILLLYEPLWLFHLGFQFSYLATAGILVGLSSLNNFKIKSKLVKYIVESTAVSFSAQGAVIPISLYYFKQIPIWFFLTNIPAFICAFALLLFSILFLLFSGSDLISDLLVFPIEWSTDGIYFLIEAVNYIPIRMITLPISSIIGLISCYFILYASFLFFTKKAFSLVKWILIAFCILLLFP